MTVNGDIVLEEVITALEWLQRSVDSKSPSLAQVHAEKIIAAIAAMKAETRVAFLVAEAHGWQPKLEEAEQERDDARGFCLAADADAKEAEARVRDLEAALREFHEAWLAVQEGICDFDLHNDAVTRLEVAEFAVLSALHPSSDASEGEA